MIPIRQRIPRARANFSKPLHPVLQDIYLARGIGEDAQLSLSLNELLPPATLLHVDKAAAMLVEALQCNSHVLVVGDFDADGATSSALAVAGLQAMGMSRVNYLVPNRFEYGYGLTPEIVEVAALQSPDLIITVDNGISSHAGIDRAHELGIKVLVTDHHLPAQSLPAADCIVNPNQPDCGFASKALAGVGVVFYLLIALRSQLRELGWFTTQKLPEPNLAGMLDLVALGTVADVVPLDDNNRRLVRHGLQLIRTGKARPGIVALLEAGNRNPATVVASDLGFAAGPRLNAAGRLDDMSLGIACLLAEDEFTARRLAQELESLNQDRKIIEQGMQNEALKLLDGEFQVSESSRSVCLYNENWHQGVIGILASRLKDRFHRPVLVFADSGEQAGMIKGSARSIQGIHIRDMLDRVASTHPAMLSKFGGHAMAAGLSLARESFNEFAAAFEAVLQAEVAQEVMQAQVYCDGQLAPECMTLEFAELLREAGPWGQQFPEPVFQGEFRVLTRRVLGDKHLKLTLQLCDSDLMIDAIAFNQDPEVLQDTSERVNLLYRLNVNEFRGQKQLQLMIEKLDYPDTVKL